MGFEFGKLGKIRKSEEGEGKEAKGKCCARLRLTRKCRQSVVAVPQPCARCVRPHADAQHDQLIGCCVFSKSTDASARATELGGAFGGGRRRRQVGRGDVASRRRSVCVRGGVDVRQAEAEAEGKDKNDGRLVAGVLQDARQSSAARARCASVVASVGSRSEVRTKPT